MKEGDGGGKSHRLQRDSNIYLNILRRSPLAGQGINLKILSLGSVFIWPGLFYYYFRNIVLISYIESH